MTPTKDLVRDVHLQAAAASGGMTGISRFKVNEAVRNYLWHIAQRDYCHCETGCELGTQHKRAEELLNLILWTDEADE